MMKTVALLALGSGLAQAAPSVLVSGATGRTGSILYKLLKASEDIGEVRALVTNIAAARASLSCDKCDESEGIYTGDVTKPESLTAAVKGINTLAIATGAGDDATVDARRDIDFVGMVNQVTSFVQGNKNTRPTFDLRDTMCAATGTGCEHQDDTGISSLRVILLSSMGTTYLNPAPFMGGSDMFWKLNAESWLSRSSVPSLVLKPCALGLGDAGLRTLHVGTLDTLLSEPNSIARADVAAVMYEAVVQRSQALRFDLCSSDGFPNPPSDVIAAAAKQKYPFVAAKWK